jgi:predicted HNH restriction endonuclease
LAKILYKDLETNLPKYEISHEGASRQISQLDDLTLVSDDWSGDKGYLEGVKEIVVELRGYRNKKLRNLAIQKNGYICYVCGSNYEGLYGENAKSVFEIHHLHPISNGERITETDDVVLVCSNCHHFLHSKGVEPFPVEEMRKKIHSIRRESE